MSRRYFVESAILSEHVTLAGSEAHHLLHVMRAQPGDEVTLLDGSGAEFAARITKCSRREVALDILARQSIDREVAAAVTLAVALPKGDRQRWLVEKATELGVARIVPLITARGVAQPTPSALEKLRRTVIEASKQCGRNRLLEIAPPQTLADQISATPPGIRRWLAHPGGPLLADMTSGEAVATCAAIGPEGGFSDEEIAQATAQGWDLVSLGPRILRIETAALLVAARVVSQ